MSLSRVSRSLASASPLGRRLFAPLALALSLGAPATASELPEPLTLEAAMRYAKESAPAVGSAEAQALLARARVKVVESARWPTLQGGLSTSAGAQASQVHISDLDSCLDPTKGCARQGGWLADSGADASLSVRWLLWDFGRTSASIRSAAQTAEAAAIDVETIGLQAALEAAAAFLDMAANEELIEAQARIVDNRARALSVAEDRVRIGVAAPIEATRAKVSLETARLDLATADAALETARASLARALGVDPTRPLTIARGSSPALILDAAHAAALAAESRPELRSARLRVAVSEAGEEQARAGFLPSLSASANASAGISAYTTPGLNSSEVVGAGLTLSIPLFDRALFANLDVAEAQTAAAKAAAREQELSVRANAAQAAIAVSAQRQALAQAEQLVVEADANLAQAEGRYKEGAGALLELIDAQTQAAQAQLSLVRARYQLGASEVRLRAATGAL